MSGRNYTKESRSLSRSPPYAIIDIHAVEKKGKLPKNKGEHIIRDVVWALLLIRGIINY